MFGKKSDIFESYGLSLYCGRPGPGVAFKMFNEYGLSIYCGRFGKGRFLGMVNYLDRMHKKYPDALIVTNFYYEHATHTLKSFVDFLEIRNGLKGVIFAIDKIDRLYNFPYLQDYPEDLLFEILCQAKRLRIKVITTTGNYFHVAKRFRLLCYTVVFSSTFFNRFLWIEEYDAFDYEIKKWTELVPLKIRLNLIPTPRVAYRWCGGKTTSMVECLNQMNK